MYINKNQQFNINITAEGYEKKTDATACLSSKGAKAINRKKMCFFEKSVNVDDFIDYAIKGHAFCSLYRFEDGKKYWYENKKGQKFLGYPYYQSDSSTSTKGGLKIDFKRDEYFFGSQVIFVDIDKTNYTEISEYIESLSLKPTCIYMSFSDNKDKHGVVCRRFHCVYVFDKILNSEEFLECSKIISNTLSMDTKEELDDDCGNRKSQYFNGVFGNEENYKTYNIYSIEDIKKHKTEEEHIITTTINLNLQKEGQLNSEEIEEDENTTNYVFPESVLTDWDNNDIDDFLKTRSWNNLRQYNKYIWRVEKEWIDGLYQYVDEDYFKLYWETETKYDGSKRRKTLYQRMCLRKIMKPTITIEELVVGVIIDIIRHFDNSDGVLNSDFIRRNIISCMDATIEEIEEKFSSSIEYLRNTTKPANGIIYINKDSIQAAHYSMVSKWYNPNSTVMENFNNPDNKFSIRFLYDYCKVNGYKTSNKVSDEDLMVLVDKTQSIRWNVQNLRDSYDIKVGKDRISRIINTILQQEEHTPTTINLDLQKEGQLSNTINEFPKWDLYVPDFMSSVNTYQYFEEEELKPFNTSDYKEQYGLNTLYMWTPTGIKML